MQRKFFQAIVLALLILVAGCTGGGGIDGPTTTTTTVSTPPGGDVVADDPAERVRQAGSFTASWSFETTTDGAVADRGGFDSFIDVRNERSLLVLRGDLADGNVMENFYADGVSYARIGSAPDTFYMMDDEAEFDEGNWLGGSHAYTASDLDSLRFVGTKSFDGTTVRHFETTDTSFWWWATNSGDDVEVTDFVFTIYVDDDGLVRYESWSVTTVDDAKVTETTSWVYSLTGIGSTVVDDPAWLEEAKEYGSPGY